MSSNFRKQASRAAAGAALTAPVLGLAGGVAAGRKARQKVRSERERVRVWRGEDGALIVTRSPKIKKAFDQKLAYALQATGADVEKVAAAYEAELEKIAVFNLLGRGVGMLARGARGAGQAVRGAGQAASGAASGVAGAAGRAVGGARQASRQAVESFQAGMGGRTVGQARAAGRLQQAAAGAPAAAASTGRKGGGLTGSRLDEVARQRQKAKFRAADQQLAGGGPTPPATQTPPTAAAAQSGATPPAVPGPAPALQQGAEQVVQQGAEQGGTGLMDWASQRYNLAGLQGQQPSAAGVGQWFGKLDPRRKAEIAAMMGAGAVGTGFAGGTAVS